ncbi:speriolin-like [Ranitomeya variabilis]|uniref:speriolin-like n=1 Tax=Ranitomeya variabilis TaxID=490064 RepID=UPI004057930B
MHPKSRAHLHQLLDSDWLVVCIASQIRRVSALQRTSENPEKVKKFRHIVGEMASQLDCRILSSIFREQERLYGYRVANIEKKILQVTTCPLTGKVDENLRSELYMRYHDTMSQLKKLGYNPTEHHHLTEYLTTTYGIMKDKHLGIDNISSFNDPEYLSKMVMECMPSDKAKDSLISTFWDILPKRMESPSSFSN